MLYAILCYDSEEIVGAWSKQQDEAAMANLGKVQERLSKEGKLGPVARLMPTTAATTLRKGRDIVLDGPFAETKEQLLGFFVVDCASLEDTLDVARQLAAAYSSGGAYEVRPIALFNPGVKIT
ncbi:MAG TPA: YciI family protein [Polyangiales bacterium]